MTPHSAGYYHVSSSYFPNGQINTLGSNGLAPALTYNVDGEGRPFTISAASGQNPVTSTSYNTASQVTGVTYGSGDSDSFSFDSNTQLPLGYTINVGAKAQTATITQNTNRTMGELAVTDTIFSNQNQTCLYTYDEFLRLTQQNCGSVWGAQYRYDIFGNMVKDYVAGSPGTTFLPTYNASNHFATIPGTTPSYDANGNLLNDGFHQYTWDSEGNPITIVTSGTTYSLTYDALNRRVDYGSGSGWAQYVDAPFAITHALGSAAAQGSGSLRIDAPGGGQVIVNASGVSDYRRPNWQGSEPIDSSTSKTANSDASYTPYGQHYVANGFSGFFAGNLSIYPFFMDGYASDTRLYQYNQGRWISPDPAGMSAVDPTVPQSWNRYVYGANNPLSNVDGSGTDDNPPDISITVTASPCKWWEIWCWIGNSGGETVTAVGFDTSCLYDFACLGQLAYGGAGRGAGTQTGGTATPSKNQTRPTTGTVNYCAYQGSALSPQQYAAQGKSFAEGITALGESYGQTSPSLLGWGRCTANFLEVQYSMHNLVQRVLHFKKLLTETTFLAYSSPAPEFRCRTH